MNTLNALIIVGWIIGAAICLLWDSWMRPAAPIDDEQTAEGTRPEDNAQEQSA